MAQSPTVVSESHALRREFSLWSAFAFAFAFISPIVALYGIFGLALSAAGASFWWGFLLVFGGQFLVALMFATLVSRWPLEGSIYQWSRRLLGTDLRLVRRLGLHVDAGDRDGDRRARRGRLHRQHRRDRGTVGRRRSR